MPATVVLSVTSLVYPVDASNGVVVLSSAASSTDDAGTVTSLVTASLIQKGVGLWMDQELMKVFEVSSDPLGIKCQVLRGQGGSASQSHNSSIQVLIAPSMAYFYSSDPKGRPADSVPVSPWINSVNGTVWMAQGDSIIGSPARWWQIVTNINGIGPLGVRTSVSSPEFGT